ncbi:secretin N-terminal domain-containing protein [Dechloromonas sp. ARDL1]|uniref:secretin N-terminal domain-containing protein n=1 Tax=Dechloromonas sp. ARDL1 TaxID=3322121 RepID=UPI003DA744D1
MSMKSLRRVEGGSLLLLAVVLVSGCSHPAFREGMNAIAEGRREQGIASLEEAVRDRPRDAEMKATLVRQKGDTVEDYLRSADRQRQGGQLDAAEVYYVAVLRVDPVNARANQGLQQIAADRRNRGLLQQAAQVLQKGDLLAAERLVRTVRNQDPVNGDARELQRRIDELRAKEQMPAANPAVKAALAKPVALEFRDATLKSVFEVLSRSSGLNFVFDKDVKGDGKVTLFVRNSPLEDIIKLILSTNQLEKRQLNDNSFLIYPNTPAKAKEYQELVVRSFYLANTDVKQAQNLVKTVAKSKDVFADEKLNLLIVKDTPDAIRLVERLIDSLDLAEPEVMLEVEVLEVTRSRLMELGVDWPDSVGYGLLQNQATTTTIVNGVTQSVTTPGGSLAAGYMSLKNRSGLTSFVANPGLTLNIKGQNGDTNVLANPRIRVKNKEKAKIHIGEKLPVFTTTSTANVGVSASVNYLDVGLKLDVEPNVSLDDEVSIKVGLEVSSIVKEVSGPSSSLAYQVGTRSASTVLRLKNGETQVLAGLISDEERKSTSHIPGFGEVPIIGRLFGSQRDTSSKTEIMLLITPRIMRNVTRPEFGVPAIGSGTESAVGAPSLSVRTPGPKSLALSSKGAGPGTREPIVTEAVARPPEEMQGAPEGMQIQGPGEAAGGSDIALSLLIPGLVGGASVDISFDPALIEAVAPAASGSGRMTVHVDPGGGTLRLRALAGASGETRIAVVGAISDNGEAIPGVAASHAVRLLSP